MARARDNPQAWAELLIALEKDDVKAAQKIANKHGFGKDQQPSKYKYFCKLPEGKVLTFGNAEKLADFLGVTPKTLGERFSTGNLTFKGGKRKGYEIWRKLKSEDE